MILSLEYLNRNTVPAVIARAFRYACSNMSDDLYADFIEHWHITTNYRALIADVGFLSDPFVLNVTITQGANGLFIEVDCSNSKEIEFSLNQYEYSGDITNSIDFHLRNYVGEEITFYDLRDILIARFCNFFQSEGIMVSNIIYQVEPKFLSDEKTCIKELEKDVTDYQNFDVLCGLMDRLGTDYLIDVCNKYNCPELLMLIVHMTQYEEKEDPDFRL